MANEGKAFLLSPEARELEADGHFDDAMEYHQVLVPRIPRQIWSSDGRWSPTTIDEISAKTERVARMKPLDTKLSIPGRCRLSNWDHCLPEEAPPRAAAFLAPPAYLGQLDRNSGRSSAPAATVFTTLEHAGPTRDACLAGRPKAEHSCRTQRINCHGPHAADHPKCPARPYSQKGAIARLSNDALTVIRKTGRTAYQQQQATLRLTNLTPQAGSLGSSQARSPLDLNYEDPSS